MADTDTAGTTETRIASAEREISAPAARIFDLIADPAEQPRWDGNDNLRTAAIGQRVRSVGEVFVVDLTNGQTRENHVVEFDENRLIAWLPAEPGLRPPGHLWRWELEAIDAGRTLVRHTYDWTRLTDELRLPRARATTSEKLRGSIDRLAAVATDPDNG
ncbi:SRPBCC family protein [Nocardia nova]|uniref:SRPBCC family protein n=1 Tax=Nocardia nova TaxID=37330 RepID=UPI0033F4B32F